jgi:diaminopimelate epimerase
VQTLSGVIAPELTPTAASPWTWAARFDPRVPFDAAGLVPVPQGLGQNGLLRYGQAHAATVLIAVVSMGNPHAVQLVEDVDTAPVAQTGPLIECHTRFPQRVNAGYLQVTAAMCACACSAAAGETLACGTGACAAVAAGIRLGLLDARVDVQTRGGLLTIAWSGQRPTPCSSPAPP